MSKAHILTGEREYNSANKEILLENFLNFKVKVMGSANATLFNNTLLLTDETYCPPDNHSGLPFTGRIPITWESGSSAANQRLLVYFNQLVEEK